MSRKQKNVLTNQKNVSNNKIVKVVETGDSYYNQQPSWAFTRCDFCHDEWGLENNVDNLVDLLKRLKAFEGQTWGEIFSDTSGRKSNTKNHEIEIRNLCPAAQVRLQELNLADFDSVCSLSVSGKKRLFGIRIEKVFHIIWLDLEHAICPAPKRHS